MNTPEDKWWSVRSGEYVLGTLRGKDLDLFEKILAHDTAVQAEVARWERELAALNQTVTPQAPKSDLLPGLMTRIRAAENVSSNDNETQAQSEQAAPAVAATTPPVDRSSASEVVPISSRQHAAPSRLWPTLTGLATAACLVLSVLLFQRTAMDPAAPSLSVDGLSVVLSDDGGVPFFLVETDYGNSKVRVTALSPPSIENAQKFQLWQALPDRSGVRPVALLPEQSGTATVLDVGSLIDGSDLFGVSIEPVDLEPTDDGPTGPVVAHGDFVPKRDI